MNKQIILTVSSLLLVTPTIIYAQYPDVSEVLKESLNQDAPFFERIIVLIVILLGIGFCVFVWKGLPALRDIDQNKKKAEVERLLQSADDKIKQINSQSDFLSINNVEFVKMINDTNHKLTLITGFVEKINQDIFDLRQLHLEAREDFMGVNRQLENDRLERVARYKSFDNRFLELEKKQDQLIETVAEHDDLFDSVSQGTLENMLFNDSYPILYNRLKAFYRLTAAGINHRVLDKGKRLIMASDGNKDMWLDIKSLRWDIAIIDKDYFDRTMSYLDKLIRGEITEGFKP